MALSKTALDFFSSSSELFKQGIHYYLPFDLINESFFSPGPFLAAPHELSLFSEQNESLKPADS